MVSGNISLHTGAAYVLYTKEEGSRDHYQVLGVGRNATRTEIRSAFVTLSKQYHPDSNPWETSEYDSGAFVAVSEAYHTLRSPKKRAQYDRELAVAEAYQQSMYRGGRTSNTHNRPFTSDRYPSYSPGGGSASHQYYSYDENDVDWELYRKSIKKPNHSRLLFMLLGLTFAVPVVFMLKISHNYHKYYQPAAMLESQRNTAAYKAVRERAQGATVQEQLDLLVARHGNRASENDGLTSNK